jgi:hypothetical protein
VEGRNREQAVSPGRMFVAGCAAAALVCFRLCPALCRVAHSRSPVCRFPLLCSALLCSALRARQLLHGLEQPPAIPPENRFQGIISVTLHGGDSDLVSVCE